MDDNGGNDVAYQHGTVAIKTNDEFISSSPRTTTLDRNFKFRGCSDIGSQMPDVQEGLLYVPGTTSYALGSCSSSHAYGSREIREPDLLRAQPSSSENSCGVSASVFVPTLLFS